jgi:cytoskeleton protein RodZ
MDDTDNSIGAIEAEEAESVEKIKSVGQMLQAARLDQGMSIQDVTRQLRLSERQVTAIEADDLSKFPNRTFLRGFIRNYAKLVRKDTEEFSQLLQQTFPTTSTQAISYPVDGTPFTPDHKQSRGNIIIILVAVLVSLLLIYEVYRSGGDSRQTGTNIENGTIAKTTIQLETEIEQGSKIDQIHLPSVINSNGSNFNSLTEGAETDQQKSDSLDEKQQVKTETEVTHKPVEIGESTFHFVFNEESWVEIKDAGGKRIFSQTSPGNTEKTIYGKSGKPPFSLTIGNAANVRLVYNANPVDLIPYTKNAGVARLSLD